MSESTINTVSNRYQASARHLVTVIKLGRVTGPQRSGGSSRDDVEGQGSATISAQMPGLTAFLWQPLSEHGEDQVSLRQWQWQGYHEVSGHGPPRRADLDVFFALR
jgi:hypothetical protein